MFIELLYVHKDIIPYWIIIRLPQLSSIKLSGVIPWTFYKEGVNSCLKRRKIVRKKSDKKEREKEEGNIIFVLKS